ncbi:hypothetical protein AKJ35_00500 [candidate division MSBL1 archaeon SCGC-AAA833F18]|uniref:Phosphatidate cytidylyltransferase n=2 Tax=candidate division MSBL1 TaxID=215777 RepID=A0A133VRV2_9EURY|nr:hypothetical protein AKJ46_00845 [candidate division MSBL1 archaeon SCGC-AAA833K04]KXB09623.1 hypothetical protein AKJ35_00500 [candidate division MSBL1 archaeon SCGC-AAA833F18]
MESLEVKRQVFHGTLGVVFVALLYFGTLEWLGDMIPLSVLRSPARPLLIFLAVGVTLILLSRKYRIPLIYWFLTNFERREEIEVFPGRGAFFAVLGIFLVVALFELPIAMASITILALGDSISHLVGQKVGRTKHPLSKVKFLEGHIAGILISAAAATLFVPPLWALIAASVAMFVEGIDVGLAGSRMADDNLIIPVTAGVVLFIISSL